MADPGRNPTVVIADDDALIRAVLRVALEKRGFTVVEAEDGSGAASAVASDSPDLLILDARMPGATLSDTLVTLRGVAPRLPVLILSGQHEAPPEAASAYTAFLAKPVQLEDLWSAVDSLVGRSERG